MYKIVLSLALLILIISGCSGNQNSINKETLDIIQQLDSSIENNHDLTEESVESIKSFLTKYATESQIDKESILATQISSMYLDFVSIIDEEDLSKREKLIDKYEATKIKVQDMLQ